ncbi:hypothetical protein EYE40_09905 [Glaciihabitans arcticus]|uniref:Uncharacterized protein n=1 Tax=Glaciihabitans arcticus TaxID=2668039 RepID=A0A4Q9GST7_9MICO|nr:hypothetical protein [Glaciihabitans arcticus]TBN57675.1 hypothetical protein EYE40_09905 [Glaciihabitans arcticus]
MITPAAPTRGSQAVVWSSPDAGLWVASTQGDYAGMIEFADGRFVVTDATGRAVGTATSIPLAKLALAAGTPIDNRTGVLSGPLSLISRITRPAYRRGGANVA